MSSAYLYTPHLYPASNPYVDSYFNQTQPSPFIPDSTLYPPSPYTSAPNTPRRVRFDDELFPDPLPRVRRPSWHGGQVPVMPSVAIPQAGYSPFLQPDQTPRDQRRHSFGNSSYYTGWSPYATPAQPYAPFLYPPQPQSFHIHPLLNGESPRPDFHFDLSSPRFSPVIWLGPGQVTPLTMDHFSQPATHPPITRLRIVCDIVPQWPIDLEYNPYQAAPSVPITLGDILIAIHRSLHTRISHIDWAKLSVSEETAVARAYTRRCKSIPSVAQFEASQGVRRVDYLLDKVMFRGLLRVAGGNGFDTLKLVVG